jgi:hypothetical protein
MARAQDAGAVRRWGWALVMMAGAACGGAGERGGARAGGAPPLASPTEAPWTTVSSAEGGFSVEMPGTPTASRQMNGDIPVRMFVFSEGKTAAYTLSYNDLPRSGPARQVLDGVLKSLSGAATQVGTRKEITIQGHPGVDAEFTPAEGGHMWYRVVLVGSRMYQLILVARPGAKDTYQPRAQRYLGSFAPLAR